MKLNVPQHVTTKNREENKVCVGELMHNGGGRTGVMEEEKIRRKRRITTASTSGDSVHPIFHPLPALRAKASCWSEAEAGARIQG